MKILKLFLVFQLSYISIVYLLAGITIIIGFGFFQNIPELLSTITRIVLYPIGIVMKVFSNTNIRQMHHFIIVIISSVFVAVIFTALFLGIKAVMKKL